MSHAYSDIGALNHSKTTDDCAIVIENHIKHNKLGAGAIETTIYDKDLVTFIFVYTIKLYIIKICQSDVFF